MGLLGCLLALQKGDEVPQEEFDEVLETELRGCIRQALACATLGAAEMECLEQAMRPLGGEETRRLADFGAQEHDACVLDGILGYIAARNGGEAEVTPEGMAVSVCLAQDAKRVLMDAEEGALTEEEAVRTMALIPVYPTFIRKPVAMTMGSLAVEYTAEPLAEGAVRGGWRSAAMRPGCGVCGGGVCSSQMVDA